MAIIGMVLYMVILRSLICLLFLLISLIFIVPIQILAIKKRWSIQHTVQQYFSKAICRMIGVKIFLQAPCQKPDIQFIVSNHVTWLDILCISSVFPVVFVAKSEVASWPLLGIFARIQNTIFIPRHLKQKVHLINKQITDVLDSGKNVVIFPEGTSSNGLDILPFYASHFEPIKWVKKDINITPVAISYRNNTGLIDVGWYGDTDFITSFVKTIKIPHKECHIFVGDQIDVAGKHRKDLCLETECLIRGMLSTMLNA